MRTDSTQICLGLRLRKASGVEAGFDGGAISSVGGALLLGATDRALVDRFTGCFRDNCRADLIEHELRTPVSQRVFGHVPGHEDLDDHDRLCGTSR